MIETILFYIHSALLLIFGVVITFGFAGISFTRRTLAIMSCFTVICGLIQLGFLLAINEKIVWDIYPLIVHCPLLLMLIFGYRRSLTTSLISIFTAYMCCQPAKWVGLVVLSISNQNMISLLSETLTLLITGAVILVFFMRFLSSIFLNGDKNALIFGAVPAIYYVFDYLISPFFSRLSIMGQTVFEFMPFLICVFYLVISSIYYQEYDQKKQAELKDHLVQIIIEQQCHEVDLMKVKNEETRILRHDLRHLLNNVAISLQNEDKENALNLISSYVDLLENTQVHRYCANDTINYLLTHYAQKCVQSQVQFEATIEMKDFNLDELLFSSILSNGLDNAFNAVTSLEHDRRIIKVMIKSSNGKILLSIHNHFNQAPVFKDGIPVTSRDGHGYGTQSIKTMTERLGGNIQFSTKDDWFILRIVI